MAYVLLIAGVVLITAAVRNTQQQLFFLLAHDFTGPNNFIYWALSILIIGAIGYIPKMKPLSDGFLILVILVLILKRGSVKGGGGFFEMFQRQISSTESAHPNVSSGSGSNPGGVVSVGFTPSGSGSVSSGGITISPGGGILINGQPPYGGAGSGAGTDLPPILVGL